ncbi:MAG: hypothetical protein EAZ29_11520 [Runella slithyformis]|nr:MAG: hypothetical protein EAZ29_11520 [Runella slithyformis]
MTNTIKLKNTQFSTCKIFTTAVLGVVCIVVFRVKVLLDKMIGSIVTTWAFQWPPSLGFKP